MTKEEIKIGDGVYHNSLSIGDPGIVINLDNINNLPPTVGVQFTYYQKGRVINAFIKNLRLIDRVLQYDPSQQPVEEDDL